ncbi:alpha/beta hydrolase [Rhodococcus sp. P-2]|uniref:alpha/beta hydrolase n=1 Tax=Rhodococcus sp. P-2 TaxID=2795031 RepID=UPI001905B7DD|nr:alpha/beta hydrolase [Rhodococcus sp. P-2]QQM23624.1 alpha/beta hydrolase [Rhodococcus sp. P-2]
MDTVSTDVRHSTVEYAPGLHLDIVRPKDPPQPLPAIVWIHGGGWRLQDRTACPDLAKHFAAEGYVMVSIDYRLAPDIVHPGQLLDVRRAVRWLRSNAAEHRVDPDRIGLWGSSAGGHLAALAGIHSSTLRLDHEEASSVSSAVQAVVDGYGPADLPALVNLSSPISEAEQVSPEASLLGGPIRDNLAAARDASPALVTKGGTPPFLVMHGIEDTMVPHHQSVSLYDSLAAYGNDVILYLVDGFGHGFFNPGNVLELGPGLSLDQGHLERDPSASATVRASTDRGRRFVERHPCASFATIEAFFSRTLKAGASLS